jgi:uncharacterized protein
MGGISQIVGIGTRVTALLMLAHGIVAAAAPPGWAQETSELYQATAIVTGSDTRYRSAGFAQCLRDVLVKVSGEPRLHDDPRIAELVAHADALVVSFSYVDQLAGIPIHDDQGTYDRPHDLTVHFDPERIDKALAELGEQPWRGERPVVVPVLVVRGVAAPYLLSAENPAGAEQRTSFADMAREYGMTVRIPTEAEFAAWAVTVDRFPAPRAESSPRQAVIAGTLEFQEALPGWVGSWRMRWHGVDYAWQISGVNYDKAFVDIVRGVVRVASGHGDPD